MSDQLAEVAQGAKVGPHIPDLPHPGHQHWWLLVMCLTGVDYFSTLGYQPSIAFEATGLLTPFATVLLVLVTLFGALPVYSHVASQSSHGQGSIAMLERLVRGWSGKALVLVLLGFAATDFVITKTLSAADAAEHVLKNPLWQEMVGHAPARWQGPLGGHSAQLVLTLVMLVFLGATFLRGFREVIGLAVVIVGAYLVLNFIVVGSGLWYLSQHPGALARWHDNVWSGRWHFESPVDAGTGLGGILFVCVLLFPKLALGLSGFETGVAVMPLIKGDPGDDPYRPQGRIRNARKLLLTAAVIMSVFLLGSSVVVSTLIAPEALTAANGAAKNRALAYLAHGEPILGSVSGRGLNPLFGEVFGTIYDGATVVILWFAGASAMAGLLNLVPHYLPRYGMAPEWTRAIRPLVLLFTVVNLFVTWAFSASVEAQGAAYATGVLVLMSSACLATVIDLWRARQERAWYRRLSLRYAAISVVFLYTTLANIWERPVGLQIAFWFILAIIVSSVVSRLRRSTELRFHGWQYKDDHSRFLWESLKHLEFPVLVPHRPGSHSLREKEETIRREHHLGPEIPIVFIEATLGDASDFYNAPALEVIQEEGAFIVRIERCASIAHTLAALALELSKVGRPPELHFGWSQESPMVANLGFLFLGEGNVPWMVRELILEAEPDPARQPRVIIG